MYTMVVLIMSRLQLHVFISDTISESADQLVLTLQPHREQDVALATVQVTFPNALIPVTIPLPFYPDQNCFAKPN